MNAPTPPPSLHLLAARFLCHQEGTRLHFQRVRIVPADRAWRVQR